MLGTPDRESKHLSLVTREAKTLHPNACDYSRLVSEIRSRILLFTTTNWAQGREKCLTWCFPDCAPRIPKDPRPVSRESIDTFLKLLP